MFKIKNFALATGLILCTSLAIGEMVTAPPPSADNKDTPKGINRTPPLSPVMSSDEFQNKISTMTKQNFKSMSEQGYNSIQQQLSALPSNMPHVPSGSGSAKTPANEQTTPSPPATANPPAPSQPPQEPVEATPGENTPENASQGTSPGYSGFSTGGSPPSQGSSPSQGSEGQLNIHY